jgi:hypothetical protein
MILGQMLGSPQETVDFYKNDNGQMDDVQMAHIRQHVTGPSLTLITNKVYLRLRHNISEQFSNETDELHGHSRPVRFRTGSRHHRPH